MNVVIWTDTLTSESVCGRQTIQLLTWVKHRDLKKHRVGTVENVLSFGITLWTLSGQPFEYQTKWKQVLLWNPNIAVLSK